MTAREGYAGKRTYREDAEARAYLYKQNTERICTEVIIENMLNFSTEQEEIRMEEKSREVVMAISNAASNMDPINKLSAIRTN